MLLAAQLGQGVLVVRLRLPWDGKQRNGSEQRAWHATAWKNANGCVSSHMDMGREQRACGAYACRASRNAFWRNVESACRSQGRSGEMIERACRGRSWRRGEERAVVVLVEAIMWWRPR